MIEIDIIEHALKGDKHSFKLLYDAYKHKVFGTAFLVLRDKQYAKDVVQETFLQVYLKIKDLSNLYGFDKWIYRITTGLCIDRIRKLKRIDAFSIEDESVCDINVFLDDSIGLEDSMIKKEMQLKIIKGINSLSIKHRTVLTLFYYNDFNISEIAEIMNCTEGTVKSRLFYARNLLKEKFEEQNLDFSEIAYSGGGALYGNK